MASSVTRSRDESGLDTAPPRQSALFEVMRYGAELGEARRIPIGAAESIALGRSEAAVSDRRKLAIAIDDDRASTRHAELVRSVGVWLLRDLRSKNGTFVNGRRITEHAVADGDVIEVGHTFLVWRDAVACGTDVVRRSIDAVAPGFATLDPDVERVVAAVEAAARGAPILLAGESGTGKELMARALHDRLAPGGPRIVVDAGALVPDTAALELFGPDGLFRAAAGGSLFLDEVGNLPERVQAMLLRVLETGELRPLGERVDVQILAATNIELHAPRFRVDLLHRIAARTIALPPLRARRVDLGLIVAGVARALGIAGATLDLPAARALFERPWPGNVRELRHALATAVDDDGVFRGAHLAPHAAHRAEAAGPSKAQLDALLVEHQGNLAAVARALRTSRSQIHRLIERMGIDLAPFRNA